MFDQFRKQWEFYDRPEVVFACPTCKKMFDEYLPEIKGRFLYMLLADLDIRIAPQKQGDPAAVFDPCSAREDINVQLAVRKLSEKAGYELVPLHYEGDMARCCGFGGNSRVVNPEKAYDTAERRIAQGKEMYITYCVNCRDIFAEHGKEAIHILDALLDLSGSRRTVPTVTQRRRNRELLKLTLLKEFCGSKDRPNDDSRPNVVINDKLKQKLNKTLILEDDIIDVIAYCEVSGSKVRSVRNITFCGYRRVGRMTYWVEYRYAEMPHRIDQCIFSQDNDKGVEVWIMTANLSAADAMKDLFL